MSGKLLDTDTIITLARGRLRTTSQHYAAEIAARTPLHVSTISLFEFRYGMRRSPVHAAQESAFQSLVGAMQVVPFEQADADRASLVKADLAGRGLMIGPYDILIAGQALLHGLTLVTGNTREFSRVAGLALEDWTQPPP